MTTPALTKEQRRAGFERALKLRRERAELKRYLSASNLHPDGGVPAVFRWAWDREVAQGMKVIDLLRAVPGIGQARAEKLLQTAGIPEKNTVRACGPKQTERLFQALEKF